MKVKIISHPASLCSINFSDMELHHLRHILKKGPHTSDWTPVQDHTPPHPWLGVFNQKDPSMSVRQKARWGRGQGFWLSGFAAVMVPNASGFIGMLHVDWFWLAPVRAEVTAPILEFLQMFDNMCAAGGGHSPHTKWKGHLHRDKICIHVGLSIYHYFCEVSYYHLLAGLTKTLLSNFLKRWAVEVCTPVIGWSFRKVKIDSAVLNPWWNK